MAEGDSPMEYEIALEQSEEGYSVSVPGLPGCWSQGASEEEALQNIQTIQGYLAACDDLLKERHGSRYRPRRLCPRSQPTKQPYQSARLLCLAWVKRLADGSRATTDFLS